MRMLIFRLFVPKSLFEAEEKNAEGFAKEVRSCNALSFEDMILLIREN